MQGTTAQKTTGRSGGEKRKQTGDKSLLDEINFGDAFSIEKTIDRSTKGLLGEVSMTLGVSMYMLLEIIVLSGVISRRITESEGISVFEPLSDAYLVFVLRVVPDAVLLNVYESDPLLNAMMTQALFGIVSVFLVAGVLFWIGARVITTTIVIRPRENTGRGEGVKAYESSDGSVVFVFRNPDGKWVRIAGNVCGGDGERREVGVVEYEMSRFEHELPGVSEEEFSEVDAGAYEFKQEV